MGKILGSRLSELKFPPDVYEYARSYRLPNESDLRRISDVRSDYAARRAAIIEEISQLELPKCKQIHDNLLAEESFIKLQIEACDSLVSTHRQLPPEILIIIFQYYLDALDDTESQPNRSQSVAVLCLVSRSWRAATISNPAFWSPIIVSAQAPSDCDELYIVKKALPWLTFRMGLLASMPWRLDLATNHLKRGAFGGPSSQAFKGQFTRLFSVFSHPAMKSLQRLAVDCDHTSKDLVGRKFPSVDSILTTSEEEDMAVWQALGKPFPPLRLPFLPKLRKAVFAALPREFFSLRAWNLTHLHIGGPNMDVKTWSRIMHVCARLVKGCFVLMKNEDDADGQLSSGEPIPIPPIVVQKELKELTLLIEIELEPRGTTFHWPALTKFAMYYGLTHSTFWMPALMDEFGLGQGRSPLLSHLTLIGDDGHDGASLVLLQALPTLEELCITVSDEAEEIISWLSLRTDQTLSLPHLRALGLRLVEGNEDFDPADSDDDDDEAEESHGSTLWRARMVPFVTRLIEERARHEDSGGGAPSLENLVLKISGTCQATVRYFKNRLTPVSWFGVKISVEELDYHSGFWAYKPDHGCNLNHWDEGFQDFMEANELCELYPTEGFLHKALTDDAAELRE